MAEDNKHQQFTQEQLEALRFDDIANFIPGAGILATGGRKVLPEIIEAVAPYVKKAGVAIKEAVGEMRDFYIEKHAVKEAAHATAIKELRDDLKKPLEVVYREGVERKKLDPVALDKMKGADLFVKNENDLLDYLGEKDFSKYARLAIEDERIYRETLSAPKRFLRAFHYDNAHPELGYSMALVRLGGSYDTHLAAAAYEANEVGIVMRSYLRGAVQAAAAGVAADAALSKALDYKVDGQKGGQNIQGDDALRIAYALAPEMKSTAEASLREMQKGYAYLGSTESAKFTRLDVYMEAAKHSIAKEILMIKLSSHVDEKLSSLDVLSVEQKITFIDQQINKMPEHQRNAMRETVANNLNNRGVHMEDVETHPQLA